ncbi:MAG TPA: DUF2914 domain-containing protein [Candidatus Polarisedimenticolia bacterium]|jgi:hypothetical protein|nr:DUF2914 domain-containing protein [Candidatus Polarisedimenticolia bacterium]
MAIIKSRLNERYQRLQSFRERHAKAEIALFFAAGFLFDILTLSRIDDLFTLVQQGLYLVVLAWLMLLDERYRAGVASPPPMLEKAWRFSEDVIHFLFGSLLSSFTLFYLKSTSEISSLLFLSFICALLVANELPGFRKRGPIIRFALLSLCATSYCALLLPILSGFLSKWLFVASVALSCAAGTWLVRLLIRWTGDSRSVLRRVAAPAVGMQALLVVAYFAGAIPPVPLSVQYIGIYHEIVPPGRAAEAAPSQAATLAGRAPAGRTYQLKHLRPWWKVWHHGDQDFAARPGDLVYCFARIFAPNRFRDVVFMHWWLEGPNGKWLEQGRTPLTVTGGRGEGFRAFATKKNYRPGRWRVEIELEDGRDMGVIHFNLRDDPSAGERTFAVDRL